jgi:Intrinsic membrane protein PufX
MNNDEFMLNMSRKSRLRAEMTFLMLKGAGLAALVFFSIWIGVAIIAALGRQLPEDSRSQSDPTPLTLLAVPAPADSGTA